MSVSPTTETVPSGGTANFTITLASLNGWTGNVSVGLRGGYTLGLAYNISQPILTLGAGGSNVTILRQPTCTSNKTYCAPLGTNGIIIMAYTDCLVSVPGGWCVDGYSDVNISVNINIV